MTSSNPDVAVIDQEGNGVCLSQGVTTITAAATDGSGIVSKPCTVRVTKGDPIAYAVNITPDNVTVNTGAVAQLKAAMTPSFITEALTWKSSDETVATVSQTGLVKGVKAGTATITVTTAVSGLTATATVTVKPASNVTKVTIKGSSSLTVGKSATLTAVCEPSSAANKSVTWKSGNSKIATVAQNGKVTAKSAGTVTIYATAKDTGKVTGKITIKVKPKAPSKLKVKKASKTSVKIKFRKNKTASSYQIWMKKGKGKYKLIKTTKAASFTKKGLSRKVKYTFRVRGFKKVGKTKYYSAYSKTAKLKLK